MNVVEAATAAPAAAAVVAPLFCDACRQAKHQQKDLLKCGQCRQAFYHDQTCQKKHWPQHKTRCRQLVRLQRQEQVQAQNVQVVQDHHKTNDDNNENNDSNKVRVVVALKDFLPGDVVLVESSALLFDTRLGYLGLLQAFGRASQETQQKVLNLHASPAALGLKQIVDDAEDASEARRQRYSRLEQQRVAYLSSSSLGHSDTTTTNQSSTVVSSLLTAETAQKLLAIVETNAHEILFNSNENDPEPPPPPRWMGLFCLSAMIEHSGNPNLTINNNNNNNSNSTNGNRCCHEEEEGRLEFVAERFIAKGERLSTSYIEGIYENSFQQRQALLWQEKHFYCSCDRCQRGLDECRPITQLNDSSDDDDDNNNNKCCEHGHPVLFWHAGHEQFVCGVCTSFSTSMNNDSMDVEFYRVESELVQCLSAVEQTMLLKSTTALQQGGGNCFLVVLTQLAALMTGPKWKIYIHPLHWLNVSACQLLSQAASAAARV